MRRVELCKIEFGMEDVGGEPAREVLQGHSAGKEEASRGAIEMETIGARGGTQHETNPAVKGGNNVAPAFFEENFRGRNRWRLRAHFEIEVKLLMERGHSREEAMERARRSLNAPSPASERS
jgi:hypothetical protein